LRADVALLRPLANTISWSIKGISQSLDHIMFRIISAYVQSLLEALSAAQTVTAAVAVRRTPSAAALRRLGIDPETYRRIRDY
jgi:hypothetical protein